MENGSISFLYTIVPFRVSLERKTVILLRGLKINPSIIKNSMDSTRNMFVDLTPAREVEANKLWRCFCQGKEEGWAVYHRFGWKYSKTGGALYSNTTSSYRAALEKWVLPGLDSNTTPTRTRISVSTPDSNLAPSSKSEVRW